MNYTGEATIRLEGGGMFSGTFTLLDNGWVVVNKSSGNRQAVGRVYSPARVRYLTLDDPEVLAE